MRGRIAVGRTRPLDPATYLSRLIAYCWRLGRHDPRRKLLDQPQRPYAGLRRWAHLLGYGGHFSTKSRRYSTTLGRLRAARTRVARAIARGLTPDQLTALDECLVETFVERPGHGRPTSTRRCRAGSSTTVQRKKPT